MFDNIPALSFAMNMPAEDELATYLSTDPVQIKGSVLDWWQGKREVFPHLSRMALDYLSIPGAYLTFSYLFTMLTVSPSYLCRC